MDLQSLPWYGQFLVFLLIGAVLFGFFYYFQYSPTQDSIDRIQRETDAVVRKIRTAEMKEKQMPQIKEEIARKQATLEELKQVLPEQNEVSQIIKKIQSIISSARLKIGRFAKQNESKREIYIEVPYSISLQGTYHNLGVFFDQLSRLTKIFTVNNLSISPIGSKISDYSIKAVFNTTTYIYREKKSSNRNSRRGRRRR